MSNNANASPLQVSIRVNIMQRVNNALTILLVLSLVFTMGCAMKTQTAQIGEKTMSTSKILFNTKTDRQLDTSKMKDWDIIVATDAIPSEKYAGEEFQRLYKEATGMTLPINSKAQGESNHVFIGKAVSEKLEQARAELKESEEQATKLHTDERELREQVYLAELKEQEQKLNDELKEVLAVLSKKPDTQVLENADYNFRTSLQKYEELAAKQRSVSFIIEEKNKRLAEMQKKQKQAEQILAETADLQKKIEFLQQFRSALLIAQEMLRKELVSAVNDLMSTLWNKLYPYAKWTSIQLLASDVDYTLQLRTAEGDWIDVAGFASGGERMLAALVLRLAFAKILAPQFNILILDEPTHNLDEAAINTLMLALQEHLSGFLEQLFIVTHEEKLAEVGDNIIRL